MLSNGSLLGARYEGGVAVRPADYAEFSTVQRVTLDAAPSVEARFYNFLRQQLGKPYDSKAIVALATGRSWRDDAAWFCSELGAAALEESGWLPKPLGLNASEITPRDLLMLVSPWAA